jgi:chorismate-pyruvate lyase
VSGLPPSTADLETLVGLFYDQVDDLATFTSRHFSDVPTVYRRLLAHTGHMTVTVEDRHASPVDVQVLQVQQTPTHYSRKILLRRQSDRRVVQFGIVRLALDALEPSTRDEILSQRTPLGRVLIEHGVMRAVQLLGLWEVACGRELAEHFQASLGHKTYGRTALIYCNGEPAIELLEIVAPEDLF